MTLKNFLHRLGFLDKQEREALRLARRHELYWYNAQKKIDLKKIDGFGRLARRVHEEGRTYLHLDRLYTLWQAVMSIPPGSKAIVEIGVYQGGSARFIGEAAARRGLDLPVYACDTFDGHTVVDETADSRHEVGKHFVGVKVDNVRRYLARTPLVRVVVGDIRETAATLDTQAGFGLVHVDVDVYPITKFCLEYFAPRLMAGGTIVVDDYGFKTCPGARQAADEFAGANPSFRLFHLLTGQALVFHKP